MTATPVTTQAGPCEPWCTVADVRARSPFDDTTRFPDALVVLAVDSASDLMFQLGGRRFPGMCTDTVRPGGCANGGMVIAYPFGGEVSLYEVAPWRAGHRVGLGIGCGGGRTIALGSYPVVSVQEVRENGEVLDPSLYGVYDWRWLIRTDAGFWPCCNTLWQVDPPRLEVDFTFGEAPPSSGLLAAVALARELLLAMTDGDNCVLDRRVQTIIREGLQEELALPGLVDALATGRVGIPEVDLFVFAHNPAGLRRRGRIIVPGNERRVDRLTFPPS